MKHFKTNIIYIACVILMMSCASKKKMVYFQGIDLKENQNVENIAPVFAANDQLSITVTALDNNAAIPYNLPAISVSGNKLNITQGLQLQSYLVAKDGTIDFPQLGRLKIEGLTRLELVALLQNKLKPFLVEPMVVVKLLNFKVTVLGEVARSGSLEVTNERITLLEAIGRSGDLTIYGKRNNVLVIRETNGKTEYHRVDLTSPDVFKSPVYYLKQNDVVYVEPNKPKINSSTNSSTNGIIISSVSLLLTIISITLR